jgi:hypothetical protein
MPTKGVIYYTSNRLDPKILLACQQQLRKAFTGNIVSVSLQPIDFGDTRIVLDAEPSYGTMFRQILAALEASTSEVVAFAEHDCLYDSSCFDFTPPDKNKFYYNLNWYKVRSDGLAVHWDAVQVSGLVCYRDLALKYYASRVATFDPDNFDRKFEPTVDTEYETFRSKVPMIDIRHQTNTTFNKWHRHHFRDQSTAINFTEATIRDIPGWSTEVIKSIIER